MNKIEADNILAKSKRNLRGMLSGLFVFFTALLLICISKPSESMIDFFIEIVGMIVLTSFAIIFQHSNFKKIIHRSIK